MMRYLFNLQTGARYHGNNEYHGEA